MVGVGPDRVRRHEARGLQGRDPRRAAQRHRAEAQPDPGPARGRPAGQDRRDRRHERQPGLHRRQAGRRGVLLARPVLDGADRRHHADRRNDRRDDDERPRRASRARWRCRWPPTPRRAHRRSGRAISAACAASSTSRRRRWCCPACRADLGRMRRHAAADCGADDRRRASTPRCSTPMSPAFAAAGFLPMSNAQSPGAGASAPSTRPLQPGDAVGVALLTGDFELGATGTVTHVDGDRVYAFGHPLYNLGPTAVSDDARRRAGGAAEPDGVEQARQLRRGRRHRAAGSRDRDRRPARPGAVADPGRPSRSTPIAAPSRTFTFGVVRDFTFTPLLTYLSVANVLTSYERGAGPASFAIRGSASIRAEGDLVVRRHLQRRSAGRRRGRVCRRSAHRA